MMITPSYADTPTLSLLRALAEANQDISRRDERHSAELKLAASEFDVIATLGNTTGMRMCDLAAHTLNTKSNITRVVKELVRRGLVERRRNPESEREVLVCLTRQGEDLFAETYPQKYKFLQALFDSRLTADEQRELTRLLQLLCGKS
ncbi:MAG TPA: MarR family transcriptional regulator [Armatimonadota bacterium]|nr:MarR family transcriptional regulator [Armatimonadota bacterium]